MGKKTYYATVHKDADSDFGVSFQDFPGCISAGKTLAEATSSAQEALSGHIEWMMKDGDAIPDPTRPEDIASVHKALPLLPITVDVPEGQFNKGFNLKYS